MKNIYALACVAVFILFSKNLNAQGCVAIRSTTTAGGLDEAPKTLVLSTNYRYFHSYKHFIGTEEQTKRVREHTNVINNDHSILIGGSYVINNRWSVSAIVPFMYINRSSLYEHYGNTVGNPRFNTSASGLGDIRLLTNYRLLNRDKFKLQIGAGVKLPTGNYKVGDYFHKLGSKGQDSLVYKVVDQSIQPGDGGLGVIASIDASVVAGKNLSLYASAMYMANPRNTNGVQRSTTLTKDANGQLIPLSNEFSVVDQYLVRAGARYQVNASWQAAVGGRIECIPSRDLIGRSDGFRRPGYIVSVDPAVFYTKGNHTFGLNVPIALVRNRTRNTIDILRGKDTNPSSERFGKPIQGDAAFADFLVSVSYTFRLPKIAGNLFGTGSEVVK